MAFNKRLCIGLRAPWVSWAAMACSSRCQWRREEERVLGWGARLRGGGRPLIPEQADSPMAEWEGTSWSVPASLHCACGRCRLAGSRLLSALCVHTERTLLDGNPLHGCPAAGAIHCSPLQCYRLAAGGQGRIHGKGATTIQAVGIT